MMSASIKEADYEILGKIVTVSMSKQIQNKLKSLAERDSVLAKDWQDRILRNIEDWQWAVVNREEKMRKELKEEIIQNCFDIMALWRQPKNPSSVLRISLRDYLIFIYKQSWCRHFQIFDHWHFPPPP